MTLLNWFHQTTADFYANSAQKESSWNYGGTNTIKTYCRPYLWIAKNADTTSATTEAQSYHGRGRGQVKTLYSRAATQKSGLFANFPDFIEQFDTLTVVLQRFHLYFQYEVSSTQSSYEVDIRSDTGYVVGIGSVNERRH